LDKLLADNIAESDRKAYRSGLRIAYELAKQRGVRQLKEVKLLLENPPKSIAIN
jgi:hypothetical protein